MTTLRRLAVLRRQFTSMSACARENVCVLGAGSFGSAITRVLGQSPATTKVNLLVRRRALKDEINTLRTNKQYISGDNVFPSKVTAFTSLIDSITGANIIVIVVPSNFLSPLLDDINRHKHLLADDVIVVSLVKSLHYDGQNLTTVCEEIEAKLQLPTVSLMGPNIYTEMIRDEFAEATVGFLPKDIEAATRTQKVFTTDTFRVSVCNDRKGVELCGGLKNVISLASGFCEGLGQGANTKAAVIRLGLKEMALFSEHLGVQPSTFYEESSGVGDLLLTCTVGRGRQLSKSFVETFDRDGPCKTIAESHARWAALEEETLNGMKLPDWHNAKVVYDYMTRMAEHHGPGVVESNSFPLFSAIYNISYLGAPPSTILEALKIAIAESEQSLEHISASSSSVSSSLPGSSALPDGLSASPASPARNNVNLTGKRALVTGAGNGIGRAIAEHLSRCGAHVVGMDINKLALADLRNTLSIEKCDVIECNLLDMNDIREKTETYMKHNGPIDLLVNCAGVAKFQPFFETTPEAFDLQVGVNVKALFYLTQLVTKKMVDNNIQGSVVHISSQSSTLPLADHLIYSSSKATVDHMARIQAFELGPHGIRVNTIRPTVVLTKLALEQWDEAALDVMKQQIPLRKLATTEDVALAVSWLLSDEASMVTGSTLAVDGGRSMGGFGM